MDAATRDDLLTSEALGLPLSDVIDERERVERHDPLRPRLPAHLCMTSAQLDRALASLARYQTEVEGWEASFRAGLEDDEDWDEDEWGDEDDDDDGEGDFRREYDRDGRRYDGEDDDPDEFSHMTREEARREAAWERGEYPDAPDA